MYEVTGNAGDRSTGEHVEGRATFKIGFIFDEAGRAVDYYFFSQPTVEAQGNTEDPQRDFAVITGLIFDSLPPAPHNLEELGEGGVYELILEGLSVSGSYHPKRLVLLEGSMNLDNGNLYANLEIKMKDTNIPDLKPAGISGQLPGLNGSLLWIILIGVAIIAVVVGVVIAVRRSRRRARQPTPYAPPPLPPPPPPPTEGGY